MDRREGVRRHGGVQGMGSEEPSLALLHRKPGKCNLFFSCFLLFKFAASVLCLNLIFNFLQTLVFKCGFRSNLSILPF